MVVYMNQARRILQDSLLSFHHTTRCMNNNHHQYYRIIINNIIPIRLFDYSHHKIKTVNYHSTSSCNHNNHNNNNSIIGTTIQQQYNQQQQQQQQQQQRLICPVRMMSTLNQATYWTSTRINSNNILFKLNHSTTTSSNSIRTFSTAVATKTEVNTSTDDVTTTTTTKTDNDNIPSIPPILWTTHRLNQQQIHKVDTIFHKILWLDLFESSMLNDIMNDKMGITFTNKQTKQLMNLMDQRAQEAAGNISSNNNNNNENVEEEVVGPVLVDIKLTSFDAASKIKVIKEVRSILSLGLKEAKEMVESAPITLQKGIKEEVANELKIKLETVGAKIEIV